MASAQPVWTTSSRPSGVPGMTLLPLNAAVSRHRKTNKCSGRPKTVQRGAQERKGGGPGANPGDTVVRQCRRCSERSGGDPPA